MIEKMFKLSENGTTVKTEVIAGFTTFLTMAYIVFLQPAILSGSYFGFETGMDFRSVMAATCISAAIATAVMALYARYPIAQAPGMGENIFFVLSVMAAAGGLAAVKAERTTAWEVALGVVFISGIAFLLVSLVGIRKAIVDAISPSLKNAMAVGIGLFIAFIGLKNAGLIVTAASVNPTDPTSVIPATLVKLNSHFTSPDLIVFFFGLLVTAILHVRRVRGSILIGIAAGAALAFTLKFALPFVPESWQWHETVVSSKLMTEFKMGDPDWAPAMPTKTFFRMDLANAILPSMIPFIVIFLFMDMFDTIGTLVGVSEQAGFMKDNKLPRANRAMLSDAIGTVTGACLGTSTVTSYIESAAGVEHGGRTGLTGLVVSALFLCTLFVAPVVETIGSYTAITAPALVIVGAMMIQNVRKIDWNDYSECIPAFLTIIGIPLTYSIADGLALGFISYPIIKLLGGKGGEVRWLMYVLGAVLIVYVVFFRSKAG